MAVAVPQFPYIDFNNRFTSMEPENNDYNGSYQGIPLNYNCDIGGLPSVIRQSMFENLPTDYNSFEYAAMSEIQINQVFTEEVDEDIQNFIIEHDASNNFPNIFPMSAVNLESIKQEHDSDNDSVLLDFENLDFLDDHSSGSASEMDDSSDSIHADNKSTRRPSSDSGYSETSAILPCFESISRSGSLESEDSDIDDKPYCKSNRGAKHNLLWKFLLQKLDDPYNKCVSWVDKEGGTFKFEDTVTISKEWGSRKRKNDMNFEKLSRGIRHYYKSGLMSRVSSERLVYKFHWSSVPKRHRKY
ncbi:ETS-related transcription factor Elf-4 isoform X2 [Patella vulgata]|nr:ETS-related transcription factor Elf-4 isoform X2 [Patella vulgata]XP_050408632.1 ETS-related transcription factor Elf-4 isoform X2 [Patella vulgata]